MKNFLLIFILAQLFIFSCSSPKEEHEKEDQNKIEMQEVIADSIPASPEEEKSDTIFVNLKEYTNGFAYDMKYATDDNFLNEVVYSCDNCLLRKEVADALVKANDSLRKHEVKIKFFDCYRPVDVQKKMWEIYPDARYVANPYTTGSIHNRGGAVDITLVDLNGNELEMGTSFDHFGKKAHHSYSDLPDSVLSNRKLLKGILESFGFNSISTEWWHYNFKNAKKYSLSNFKTECE